jgi:predicted ribosomally synthesized peptide with SipW-like signal peptide
MRERKTFNLTRRRVLAGLGAVGIASAGAGLGTSAYFSDVETFENNALVAGSLDMKVDWEEHYADSSPDEREFARLPTAGEEPDYVLPPLDSNGQLIPDYKPIELVFAGETPEAKSDSKDALWDTTSIEAYPDVDDDGIQEAFGETYDVNGGQFTVGSACEAGADTPEHLDPTQGLRTENEDTMGVETWKPLVSIEDVKPGDFGEVTFSFHLCDNPGYVWMNGELVSAFEGGHTEPEAKDPDEIGGPEATGPEEVELLDGIVTRIWYDPNGNNQVDVIAGELDIMLAIDDSGSIEGVERTNLIDGVNAFVDALPEAADVQVGALTFGDDSIDNFLALGPVGGLPTFDVGDFDFSGNTPLPAALDIADQELRNGANARPGAEKIVVVITDGGPNYNNTQYGAGGYTAPRGNPDQTGFSLDDTTDQYDGGSAGSPPDYIVDTEEDETALVADTIRGNTTRIVTVNVADNPFAAGDGLSVPFQQYLEDEIASSGFAFVVGLDDLADVAEDLVALVAVPEQVFFQGTLREALVVLAGNDGRGIPLDGDLTTAFDEINDPENDPDRECFEGDGTAHYVGFQWWLPIDHANQIQTDGVSFDLGFYTEQCRHNDGSGMVPEESA